jgi:putative membrane protein
MKMLMRWGISAGALYLTVWILSLLQLAKLGDNAPWYSWFFAVIIMALVNACIRPVARFLTAPLNCLTFGIVGIIVNGVMFSIVPGITKAVFGMEVFSFTSFWAPVLGAILVGSLQSALGKMLVPNEDQD